MTRRSYSQYCAVARGLDVIGDRWMLLVVRDLLLGPKRYTDLLDGLPGIGTNMLALRLREMEEGALVERAMLPPPAASAVYQLTEAGRALEPAIFAIGRWGARFLGEPRADDVLLPRAYLVAIRAGFRPERAAGLAETYELRIGRLAFEVRVKDGQCTTRERSVVDPDAVFVMDVQTLNDLLLEGLSPQAALADRRIEITGDPQRLDHFVDLFGMQHKIWQKDRIKTS
jgi:DNA-binding HxlR family transcriptional regulator/putative sterol carrier protein